MRSIDKKEDRVNRVGEQIEKFKSTNSADLDMNLSDYEVRVCVWEDEKVMKWMTA